MRKFLTIGLIVLAFVSTAFAQGGSVSNVRHGGVLPATCNAGLGEVFFLTAASPTIGLYSCIATNTWSLGGTATGTISGQANGVIPLATGATTIGAQSALSDNGSTVTSSEPVTVTGLVTASGGYVATADGVHNGQNSMVGNTADAAIPPNTVGWGGPNTSATGTAYRCDLPWTNPSGGQVLSCGTPSAGVSTGTWVTPGSGTVTSIATTAPLGGGTITGSGTLTCTNCVQASSPGAGIAHFAGSTQTVTSSLIVAADITSGTITGTQIASSVTLTTPNIGAATGTSLLATGIADGEAPVIVTTGTTGSPGATYNHSYSFNEEATAGTGVTYTLPTAAAGKQYCVANAYNGSNPNTGVLTVATSASGQFIIFTDGTLSATGGNITSGGAAGDAACLVGVDATHWYLYVQAGTWTKH